jgi:hypothetical protein
MRTCPSRLAGSGATVWSTLAIGSNGCVTHAQAAMSSITRTNKLISIQITNRLRIVIRKGKPG